MEKQNYPRERKYPLLEKFDHLTRTVKENRLVRWTVALIGIALLGIAATPR